MNAIIMILQTSQQINFVSAFFTFETDKKKFQTNVRKHYKFSDLSINCHSAIIIKSNQEIMGKTSQGSP